VTQGSTSQGVLAQTIKQATLVAAPTVLAAREQLQRGELDVFATNKAILFEMADQLPGARVLPGRWGLEHVGIAVPKGREAGAAWLKAFAERAARSGLVQGAAQRAGLRGLAPADAH
jgi:polar amino acid transport system substrate-binding protein